MEAKRYKNNPVIKPSVNPWEKEAVLNGSACSDHEKIHFVYRAVSSPQAISQATLRISSIGYASSTDGVNFSNGRQLIKPEYEWEKYGCEDPRITRFNDKYFIFYTALSTFPFSPPGIKVGLAITNDFEKIDEKHPVTTFNSKAMTLFPEKINGKIAAILTANTDTPPSKIAIAFFDKIEDIWSPSYWDIWYSRLNDHCLYLQDEAGDQVEIGAPPIRTKSGWLLVYCRIKDYFSKSRIFQIQAVLLDLSDPFKIIGRTKEPLLVPEEEYEMKGAVDNIVFPSGAIIKDDNLVIYYGGADTVCCSATCDVNRLLKEMMMPLPEYEKNRIKLERFSGNPILKPVKENSWESKYVLNPGVAYEGDVFHILYRAMGGDDTSVLGYAASRDGLIIDERLKDPVYVPRENFETKIQPGNSGCEDPRITKIDDKLYMCYTAYDGKGPTRIALTSIVISDFLNKKWNWEKPVLISSPDKDDKDACVIPKKIDGKYGIFHREDSRIWMDFVDDLNFDGKKYIGGKVVFSPRINRWDNGKIGIGGPPLETELGWLLIYHALSQDGKYRLGISLLDINDPTKVIARLNYPILSPEAPYENSGLRPGTVFTCGAVVVKEKLFVYYGGADEVICVATAEMSEVIGKLKKIL